MVYKKAGRDGGFPNTLHYFCETKELHPILSNLIVRKYVG